jgi:hypothetical protein
VGRRRDPTRATNVEVAWLLVVALAVGVLVGLLIGFSVGRIGGNQVEATQPPPPRTVTVEETVETTVEKTVRAKTPATATATATATASP